MLSMRSNILYPPPENILVIMMTYNLDICKFVTDFIIAYYFGSCL